MVFTKCLLEAEFQTLSEKDEYKCQVRIIRRMPYKLGQNQF